MTQSRLHNSVVYPERTSIFEEDKSKELDIYDIYLYGIPVNICIGSVQSTYKKTYRILFCPIYLIKPSGTSVQIGVYEFTSSKLLDSSGEVNFQKLPSPLLYSFATIEYISSIVHKLDKHRLEINDKANQELLRKEKEKEEVIREVERMDTEYTNRSWMNTMNAHTQLQQIYGKNRSRKNR